MSINLCCYGCGQPGITYSNKTQKWRCAKSPSSCPVNKAQNSQAVKAKFNSLSIEERLNQKNKRQAGMLKKYGVVNASQDKQLQAKKIQTFLSKYGCENPAQNPDIIQKIKDTWPSVAAKREKTNLAKYGVAHYSSTEECKERRRRTWLANYGVDNPAKSDQVKDKIYQGQNYKKTNKTICLCGKLYRVQGFEHIIIAELLKSGFKESDIVIDKKLVPKINYFDNTGAKRRYYPDIWIPRLNMLIEVKSLYTWQKYKEINLLKIAAAKQSGYTIRVMVR